ncbi:hypothetical protein BLNAU_18830 [Blattamonas nauphoetae]|uniref:Uncharacterized protein n=1 Tax=Blattamonas nauphoetae TaxID=2049346 RepID=A0ABQ9X3S3_9EUKA|nr:hypothetical protein BLNAU_18830 [Blattamonas nauphoetae]
MLPRRHLSTTHPPLSVRTCCPSPTTTSPSNTPSPAKCSHVQFERATFGSFTKPELSWLTIANHFHPQIATKRERVGRSVLTSEQLVNEERERSAQEGGRERGTGVCLAISTSTHPPQTILLPPLSDSDRTVEQDTKRQFLIEVVQPAIFTRIRLPNSLPLHPTKAVSSTETSPRVLPHTNAPASNDVDENDDEAMEILLRSPPTTRLASPTKERADVTRATAENEDDELAETRETERSGR